MLEKIKYNLSVKLFSRQMRIKCIAVLTAVTIAVITLLDLSISTMKIFDGERSYTVRYLNGTPASVLSGLNLKSDRYKITETSVKDRLTTVVIAYSFPVFVTCGDITSEIEFTGGTVEDALRLAGYEPDEYDYIQPSADTVIEETVYIDYTDIEYVNGSYTVAIPHSTETVYSSAKTAGTTTTATSIEVVVSNLCNILFIESDAAVEIILSGSLKCRRIPRRRTLGTSST